MERYTEKAAGEHNSNSSTIDEMLCDNIAELRKELKTPSKKEKRLCVILFIMITVTVATILTFYQFPEISYWIKWISTISLCSLCNIVSHKSGLESGLEMGRKTAKAKDEFHKRMVERMVKMIRERDS